MKLQENDLSVSITAVTSLVNISRLTLQQYPQAWSTVLASCQKGSSSLQGKRLDTHRMLDELKRRVDLAILLLLENKDGVLNKTAISGISGLSTLLRKKYPEIELYLDETLLSCYRAASCERHNIIKQIPNIQAEVDISLSSHPTTATRTGDFIAQLKPLATSFQQRYEQAKDQKSAMKWQVLWLLSIETSLKDVAFVTGMDIETVKKIYTRYKEQVEDVIIDTPVKKNRKQLLDSEEMAELRYLLEEAQQKNERWNAKRVAEWISVRKGQHKVSESTGRRYLILLSPFPIIPKPKRLTEFSPDKRSGSA